MDHLPITLGAIESFIAERQRRSAFLRGWSLASNSIPVLAAPAATGGYAIPRPHQNLFLLPDWMLVGDEISIALFLHFAVVTPWIVLVGWLIKEDSPRPIREGLAGSISESDRFANPCELCTDFFGGRRPLSILRPARCALY